MTSKLRGCRLVIGPALALLTFAPLALASPAQAQDAASTCHTPNIAVLVQFPGGTNKFGCVSSATNPSGWTVLVNAGFTVQGTAQYPDTFVCRIDNFPDSQCATPPFDPKSWTYWHADPGKSTWTHSSSGAAGTHPRAASAEAWVFGVEPPTIPPANVLPTAALPPLPPTGTVNPPRITSTRPPATASKTTPSADTSSPAAGLTTPPAGGSSETLTPSPSTSETSSPAVSSVAEKSDHGSVGPVVVGGVLIAVFVAGTGTATWLRRRRFGE